MPAPALRFEAPTFDRTFLESITSYIVATCRRFRVRRADVFDVVQEALTKIVASVGSFRPEKGDFDTWARGVALNVIRRHSRNAKRYGVRFSEYHPSIDDYATHEPSPERCAQRKQAWCSISNAMKNLTPQQVKVLVSFDVHDMSHMEIGNKISITEDASHQCHKRARKHLARCLDRDLLSVLPPFVTSCDESFSLNKSDSRWGERSHYVVQFAAAIMAVFLVFALKSSTTTHEPTTSDARVLAPVQNAVVYRSDEQTVHQDAPRVKPEPASLPSVRAVSTPAKLVDKLPPPSEYVPRLSHKHEPSSSDHRPNGR